MKMEFTTTATLRPELLDMTYSSINKVLTDVDMKTEGVLYINIDPVPNASEQVIQQELETARAHFSEVHHRVGCDGGNYSQAQSWLFQQPQGDYFLNIEDDWLFEGRLSVQECIDKIEHAVEPNILQCVFKLPKPKQVSTFNRAYLTPSLYKTSTIQSIIEQHPIPAHENPERWLWELKEPKELVDYNIVCIDGINCRDNGRDWMNKQGFSKKQDNQRINNKGKMQGNFTRWNLT